MKTVKVLALAALLSMAFATLTHGAEMEKTNIGGLWIRPYQNETNGYISFGETEEIVDSGYIGLFENGSIVTGTDIIIENGSTLVPVRVIAEAFGATVEWAAENGRIIISTEDRGTVMYIGRTDAMINGKGYFSEPAPKLIGGKTYVPLRFAAEALGANVAYSDGVDLTKPYIIPRMRHVMISLYPEDATPLTDKEAVEKVREKVIEAYEKQYGEYIEAEYEYDGVVEKEIVRYRIGEMKVYSENDRYYSVPLFEEYWIDKYTADVYVFNNGDTMSIADFDVNSPLFPVAEE